MLSPRSRMVIGSASLVALAAFAIWAAVVSSGLARALSVLMLGLTVALAVLGVSVGRGKA